MSEEQACLELTEHQSQRRWFAGTSAVCNEKGGGSPSHQPPHLTCLYCFASSGPSSSSSGQCLLVGLCSFVNQQFFRRRDFLQTSNSQRCHIFVPHCGRGSHRQGGIVPCLDEHNVKLCSWREHSWPRSRNGLSWHERPDFSQVPTSQMMGESWQRGSTNVL